MEYWVDSKEEDEESEEEDKNENNNNNNNNINNNNRDNTQMIAGNSHSTTPTTTPTNNNTNPGYGTLNNNSNSNSNSNSNNTTSNNNGNGNSNSNSINSNNNQYSGRNGTQTVVSKYYCPYGFSCSGTNELIAGYPYCVSNTLTCQNTTYCFHFINSQVRPVFNQIKSNQSISSSIYLFLFHTLIIDNPNCLI